MANDDDNDDQDVQARDGSNPVDAAQPHEAALRVKLQTGATV
jgi:hypothetical protein